MKKYLVYLSHVDFVFVEAKKVAVRTDGLFFHNDDDLVAQFKTYFGFKESK